MTYMDEVNLDAPILFFPFTETQGSTWASSVGGVTGTSVLLGNNGIGINQAGPPGTGVRSLYFNTNGGVELPTTFTEFNSDGTYTLEAWANFTSNTAFPTVWMRTGGGHLTLMRASIEGGDPMPLNCYVDGHTYSQAYVAFRGWVHLAMVKSGTTVSNYVNGVKSGGGTVPGSYNYGSSSAKFRIGTGTSGDPYGNPTGEGMNGYIAAPAIYNQALTQQRIEAHYRAAMNAAGAPGSFRGWGIPL